MPKPDDSNLPASAAELARQSPRVRRSNSNGGQVSPTIDCCYRKGVSNQLAGGGISSSKSPTRPSHAFNFELWSGDCREVVGGVCHKRAHDWLTYHV